MSHFVTDVSSEDCLDYIIFMSDGFKTTMEIIWLHGKMKKEYISPKSFSALPPAEQDLLMRQYVMELS